MPALSYNKEGIELYDFKNKIIQGIKKHTIRRYGPGLKKRPFRVGDILYHYENWRQPGVNKFHENTCLWVADVRIDFYQNLIDVINILIDNKSLSIPQRYAIAKNDGFDFLEDFQNFFRKSGLPFHGQIIGWREGLDKAYET